jgi:hypothetical protein
MLFASLIAALNVRRARWRKYRRLRSEIESMSWRELADISGDRDTMLSGVCRQVYGASEKEPSSYR